MRKHIFLAGLFMSSLGIALAVLALYFIFDGTRTEVVAVNHQIRDIDDQIEKLRAVQVKNPADQKVARNLAKLSMERVLLPQPWFLQMELAEKGLTSFILNVFGSADTRRANLRRIVIERAKTTKLDGCPTEFQRLFKVYASEEGYGSDSLRGLRDFASNYADADTFSATPTEAPESSVSSESSELPETTGLSVSSEPAELPELSGTEVTAPPGGVVQEQ